MKKLLWSFFIISFIFLVPACSIKSVLDDIARDTYEKNLRKQRFENIEDPNYEDPPSYNQYQRERKKIIQDNQATIPNVKLK
ncbi:MAG: hypothetical protein ACQ9MH_19065 [Nitrospinales bacterium]